MRWRKYHGITSTAEDQIHWSALKRAMQALPPKLQRWITKDTVGIYGVGRFMKDWGLAPTNECLHCGLLEDHLHVPRCRDPLVQVEWDKGIVALSSWMDTQLTAPAIKHAVVAVLNSIRQPSFHLHFADKEVQAAPWSQMQIGA